MKREFLTGELGLSKEVTEKIMAQYGESVNSLKLENERLSSEFLSLSKKLENADALKLKVDELTELNEGLKSSVGKLTSELNESKLESALSSALIAAGAKNLKAAGALIDRTKITLDDEGERSIKEQIESIKSECKYLFHDTELSSGMRHASSGNRADGFTSMARAAAKLN